MRDGSRRRGGFEGAFSHLRYFPTHNDLTTLRRLFDRCYPALVRFLYRRLGDRDLAEDLAQEAFIRLVREDPERPEGWLFVVAANLARDAHRRDSRRARRLALLADQQETSAAPTSDQQLEQRETVATVRLALDALSERDRTLLLLHEEGVPYRELAQAIEVKESSVAPLLNRARKRLLRRLQGGAHDRAVESASA